MPTNNMPKQDQLEEAKGKLKHLSHQDSGFVFDYCLSQIEDLLNSALDTDGEEAQRLDAAIRINVFQELSNIVRPDQELRPAMPEL